PWPPTVTAPRRKARRTTRTAPPNCATSAKGSSTNSTAHSAKSDPDRSRPVSRDRNGPSPRGQSAYPSGELRPTCVLRVVRIADLLQTEPVGPDHVHR